MNQWFASLFNPPRSRPQRGTTRSALLGLEDRTVPAAGLPDLHVLPSYLADRQVNTSSGRTVIRFRTALANRGRLFVSHNKTINPLVGVGRAGRIRGS